MGGWENMFLYIYRLERKLMYACIVMTSLIINLVNTVYRHTLACFYH